MSLAKRLKQKEINQGTLSSEPKRTEKNIYISGNIDPALIPEFNPFLDPRPDLEEDSELWARLLHLAEKKKSELAGILHGFRCQGTRLKRGRTSYVLRPDIDPVRAWPRQEEYEKERDKWLKPYTKEIAALLKSL